MKKRILLSLVSFFMMTAMWASITEAYKIEVSAAGAGKTGATAELTLTMKNRNAINTWTCTLVLPAGVTFKSAELVTARVPEGYEAEFSAVPSNGDNSVLITCTGAEGVAFTGTDGAVATVTVEIAADATIGDCVITVKDMSLVEATGDPATIHQHDPIEFTWTIEQGEEPVVVGDLTGDGKVDIKDAISVLNVMAANSYAEIADLNKDQVVDIKDFIAVLNIMAAQ